jgi:hypothetical protein
MEKLNTCSDAYTGIDTTQFQTETDTAQSKLDSSIILGSIILALLALQFLLSIVWQYAICKRETEHESNPYLRQVTSDMETKDKLVDK